MDKKKKNCLNAVIRIKFMLEFQSNKVGAMIEDVSFWWWLWSCVTMYLIIFVLHSFSLFVYLDHTCLLVLLSLAKKFVLASPISRNKIELIQNMILFFQKKAPFDCLSILGTLKFFLDTSLTLQQTYYIPLFFLIIALQW